MAEVRLNNVTKRFGKTTAVDGMSLAIADGEFIVLLGPTGVGKTTLIRKVQQCLASISTHDHRDETPGA